MGKQDHNASENHDFVAREGVRVFWGHRDPLSGYLPAGSALYENPLAYMLTLP